MGDRIAQFTRGVNAQADASGSARRLAAIPGAEQLAAATLDLSARLGGPRRGMRPGVRPA
jgi:hypothetical protein